MLCLKKLGVLAQVNNCLGARLVELKKSLYTRQEVEKLLSKCQIEYNEKLNELKDTINELTDKNNTLNSKLDEYKKDEHLIVSAIKDAEDKALSIKKIAQQEYELCAKSLRAFCITWKEYFKYLLEKYPYYSSVKQSADLCKKVESILDKEDSKKVVEFAKENLDKLVKDNDNFNPKAKIQEYISATGENGFNLEEVLNPGELRLEDLCKELGLLEETE